MNDNQQNPTGKPPRPPPWNKGKLVGAKPPLRPAHVWAIRTKLQMEGQVHDLALFNLAIDSKLRGCDVVAVRVDDVAPNGYTPIGQRSGKKRPAARCNSRSRTIRDRRSTPISSPRRGCRANRFSPVAAMIRGT